ncbi:MAG TPA: dihydrolipoyl dehydrogenase [Chthoniobacterales bacterium]|nr:dihydrolipoyl dehydrogenase [Chthoniobacterales bacterium]
MSTANFDLIVFGGGNAITTAIECGKTGMKVALVERGPLGGTCPHRGCIPSKLLIGYADAAESVRAARKFGFQTTINIPDPDKILTETFGFTQKYDSILQEALGKNVTLFRGTGVLTGNYSLSVNGNEISADRVVLATGSRPKRPNLQGPYWTSDDVFTLKKMPRSITIVGGGYIACELGHFFSGIGVETSQVVRGTKILEREDEEIQELFQRGYTAQVPVRFETEVRAAKYDDAEFQIDLVGKDGKSSERISEALLFCIGRIPNTDQIGLEKTGLQRNARGFIETDNRLRTSVPNVWVMGDIGGRFMYTHAANCESEYLAKQIGGGCRDPIDYGPMPHAVFTSPETAGVGKTERELKAETSSYLAAAVPYSNTTKGKAIKEESGLCKLLIAPDRRILGCHIVGQQASALLHIVLPVMKWRNDIQSLVELIYIHPALAEIVRGAARKVAGMLPTACRDMV